MRKKPLTQNTYLVGVHRYSYRAGEVAEIIGVKWAKPEGYGWRLAYEIKFLSDGETDLVAFEDVQSGNVEIISDVQLAFGRIPGISC